MAVHHVHRAARSRSSRPGCRGSRGWGCSAGRGRRARDAGLVVAALERRGTHVDGGLAESRRFQPVPPAGVAQSGRVRRGPARLVCSPPARLLQQIAQAQRPGRAARDRHRAGPAAVAWPSSAPTGWWPRWPAICWCCATAWPARPCARWRARSSASERGARVLGRGGAVRGGRPGHRPADRRRPRSRIGGLILDGELGARARAGGLGLGAGHRAWASPRRVYLDALRAERLFVRGGLHRDRGGGALPRADARADPRRARTWRW